MDSFTHIALGAVVGEAIAGKKLGKRAMAYGAIAQSIPDLDFVAALFLSPADNLLAHRGITHSFLFAIVLSFFLALIAKRRHSSYKVSFNLWLALAGTETALHLLLDSCNAYGVGWLEPFSDKRFSFNILFVADPFYSVTLFLSMTALIYLKTSSAYRKYWIAFGLLTSTGYFIHALINKTQVESIINTELAQSHIEHKKLITTPTPLNSWLWYVIVQDDNGFYTGYRSVLDNDSTKTSLTYFPQRNDLLASFAHDHQTQQLIRFSQGLYTVEKWEGGAIVFNDLRFGQIAGWDQQQSPFVFHYYLNDSDANLMVIQRGRFSNWNPRTIRSLMDRIKGR